LIFISFYFFGGYFLSGFFIDLLPSGVSEKKRKKIKNFLILSLVIADINYCYYLFLLFDLTLIVKYFQIIIKNLYNFVHLKQSVLFTYLQSLKKAHATICCLHWFRYGLNIEFN